MALVKMVGFHVFFISAAKSLQLISYEIRPQSVKAKSYFGGIFEILTHRAKRMQMIKYGMIKICILNILTGISHKSGAPHISLFSNH